MRRLSTFVFLGAVFLLVRSSGLRASSDPLTGDWTVDFALEGTTTPVGLTLKLDGAKVSGTVFSHHTGPGTIKGSWNEPELHMTFDFAAHESIEVDGSLRDGVLSGEFRTEGRKGTWKAERGARAAATPAASAHGEAQYAPYAFLIGDWNVGPAAGGPAHGITRFKWGPNHSYIWVSQSLLAGGREEPHFEGLLLWNGVRKNLDMLVALDLRYGLAQEQGTVAVEPDGTVVRDITAVFSEGVQPLGMSVVGPAGATAHFRQTFRTAGPNSVATTVMRETDHGWVATFPGSDHMLMSRLGPA